MNDWTITFVAFSDEQRTSGHVSCLSHDQKIP